MNKPRPCKATSILSLSLPFHHTTTTHGPSQDYYLGRRSSVRGRSEDADTVLWRRASAFCYTAFNKPADTGDVALFLHLERSDWRRDCGFSQSRAAAAVTEGTICEGPTIACKDSASSFSQSSLKGVSHQSLCQWHSSSAFAAANAEWHPTATVFLPPVSRVWLPLMTGCHMHVSHLHLHRYMIREPRGFFRKAKAVSGSLPSRSSLGSAQAMISSRPGRCTKRGSSLTGSRKTV